MKYLAILIVTLVVAGVVYAETTGDHEPCADCTCDGTTDGCTENCCECEADCDESCDCDGDCGEDCQCVEEEASDAPEEATGGCGGCPGGGC